MTPETGAAVRVNEPSVETETVPDAARSLALYRAMFRIRRVEETIAKRYAEQEMRCPVHLSIGQEAAAVGACAPLSRADQIVSTHRCHGHYLAKGGALKPMIAELYGKETGCCSGRGGSMHLFDADAGIAASVPIVGSCVPLAVGMALRFQQQAERRVAVAFIGDAVLEEGVFHESMNFAATKALPVVFFVENNRYSVYTPLTLRQPYRSILRVAEAHAIRGFEADGMNVTEVERVMQQAVSHARQGLGPTFVSVETYRFVEHCGPYDDDALGYRPMGELASWKQRCPVAQFRARLENASVLSPSVHRRFTDEIDAEIHAAFEFAENSKLPEPSTASSGVFPKVHSVPARSIAHESERAAPANQTDCCEMTAAEAIREATALAMQHDPNVVVFGEGATDPKGIFGTTKGLVGEFGPTRVIEMPVSENGFTGVAIGASLLGQRPIVIHQRVEFCLLSVEQLFNNAAKMHYVSGGIHTAPLVVRLVVGRGWGQGPAHSQSLENLFAAIPGLKVVMPATADDAKGLLLGAIEEDAPVVFIEHRWIHYAKGPVSTGHKPLPLDGPKRVRSGSHITVVTSSYMTLEAFQAVDTLKQQLGCEVDLFDLRVLSPLDLSCIFESLENTGRLVTVDTGFAFLGLGAEIVAEAATRGLLRNPPTRLGLPSHPTPSSRSLAEAYYPRSIEIAAAIGAQLDISDRELASVLDALAQKRSNVPADIPHPSFRGPF